MPKFVGAKSEKQQYDDAVAACNGGSGDKAACQQRDELAALSRQRDAELQKECGSGGSKETCDFQLQQAKDSGNSIKTIQTAEGRIVYAQSTARGATATDLNPQFVAPPNNPQAGTFQGEAAASLKDGLELAANNTAMGKVLEGASLLLKPIANVLGWTTNEAATMTVNSTIKAAGVGAGIGVVTDIAINPVSNDNTRIVGAVGGAIAGVTKLGLNSAAGLPNPALPNTWQAGFTQATGFFYGQAFSFPVNQVNKDNATNTVRCGSLPPLKPC